MIKIFKYVLVPQDIQTIVIRGLEKILSVANQREEIVVYAMVNDDALEPERHIKFAIVGTGHPAQGVEDWTFLGTVNLEGGKLMFHIFYDEGDV